MSRRTVFDMAAEYVRTQEERINILEDERRLAVMNGEGRPEPEEGDLDDSGRFVYTQVGTTAWGTPVMRWKYWGIRP